MSVVEGRARERISDAKGRRSTTRLSVHLMFAMCSASPVLGDESDAQIAGVQMEETRVIGTAMGGVTGDRPQLPYATQGFSSAELDKPAFFSVVDVLEDRAASVSSNAAQNNRLQPDIQYRGFSASHLLGLSQGMAVYQNGVRLNEAFGDTVNWDLLPASSVETLHIVGGSNPVFGLNALGGSMVLRTRTGFSSDGGELSYTRGDYDTHDYGLQWGQHKGDWALYLSADRMEEEGWRDFSPSEVSAVYGALSWQGQRSEFDLFLNLGDSNLKGNGSVPVDLLRERRAAVFTHPDRTRNQLGMLSLSFRHAVDNNATVGVSSFYRALQTRTFNGDGTQYEECEESSVSQAGMFAEYLCREDGVPATDQFGRPVSQDFNAINNRSARDQDSYGVTLEFIRAFDKHTALVGFDYFRGKTDFRSSVEYAMLTASRGTTLTERFDSAGYTDLHTDIETWSVFASDSVDLTARTTLLFSARYNHTQTDGRDPTARRPALDGAHAFTNLGASAGLTVSLADRADLYLNLQTASRTPTPVELACSHPDAPCSLPNTFLADPPLDDVRSLSAEAGVRGVFGAASSYRIGAFLIDIRDDIVFQTTGGVSSNQGYFENATDTRRLGLESEFAGTVHNLRWYLNYTWLNATFEKTFLAGSPNNPLSDNGVLSVRPGSDIPGIPDHNFKLGATIALSDRLSLGADARCMSGIYLRGDEANLDKKTDGWCVMDVHTRWDLRADIYLEARLENVFDQPYETFGLYGDADEILVEVDDESGRFLGPAMPRMWWVTVGFRF